MSTKPMSADFLKEWKIGEEIGLVIDHVTKQDTTAFQINEMFAGIQELIKPYGFSLQMWGLKSNFEQSLNKNLAKSGQESLEFIQRWHKEMCVKNNVIEKMPAGSFGRKAQEILLQHNLLLENPTSGELTVSG